MLTQLIQIMFFNRLELGYSLFNNAVSDSDYVAQYDCMMAR